MMIEYHAEPSESNSPFGVLGRLLVGTSWFDSHQSVTFLLFYSKYFQSFFQYINNCTVLFPFAVSTFHRNSLAKVRLDFCHYTRRKHRRLLLKQRVVNLLSLHTVRSSVGA